MPRSHYDIPLANESQDFMDPQLNLADLFTYPRICICWFSFFDKHRFWEGSELTYMFNQTIFFMFMFQIRDCSVVHVVFGFLSVIIDFRKLICYELVR